MPMARVTWLGTLMRVFVVLPIIGCDISCLYGLWTGDVSVAMVSWTFAMLLGLGRALPGLRRRVMGLRILGLYWDEEICFPRLRCRERPWGSHVRVAKVVLLHIYCINSIAYRLMDHYADSYPSPRSSSKPISSSLLSTDSSSLSMEMSSSAITSSMSSESVPK